MTATSNALALPGQPHIAYQGSDLMVEGVRLFPRDGDLVFAAALLAVQRGFAAEARELVKLGERTAEPGAGRDRFTVLGAALGRDGVPAPRDHVVEKDVAVRDPHLPLGELQLMVSAQVGIVVSRDESRRRRVFAEKLRHFVPADGRVARVSSGSGIEGVPVQHQSVGTVEQRTQLR